jgi:hypothetical protein
MKTVLTLLIAFTFFAPTGHISMLGIKIIDTKESLANIKLEIVAKDKDMVKYKTENSNDFSVTLDNDKVVYMENDWLQDVNSRLPLFSDFTFGKTTLKDIRSKFSTNGFTFKNRGYFKTETDLIMFNCFEFDSKNNEVLIAITKISLKEDVTEETVASKLKLEALIIADAEYLDRTWGKDKVFDTNYKKIKP